MPIARLARTASGQLIWSISEPTPLATVVQAPVVSEFDPSVCSVAEVLAWIEQNPDDAERVKAVEAAGKARKTILSA